MKRLVHLPFIVIFIFALNACGPTGGPTVIKPDNSLETQAIAAEQSGDYLGAAQLYLEFASKTSGAQQAQLYLRAAQTFWQANNADLSLSTLNNIDLSQLSPTQVIEANLIRAEIALLNNDENSALAALTNLDINNATPAQTLRLLKFRAQAYQLTENWLEQANNLLQLAPLLPPAQQQQNQQALWQALTSLTPQALDLFNPGIPPSIDSGWFALAHIVKTYQSNPDAFIVALENWQRNYPNHPADAELYKHIVATGTRLPQQLNDIAILLPSTGPYANAATAIKQGILAAHYAQQSNTKLHFLDIDHASNDVWQRYQQAITLDANLVIGPLDKAEIQVLADADTLDIPVLALNQIEVTQAKDNLFQFGLAPEDDATSAANYAANKGYSRSVILKPRSEWGDRVANAFSQQWLAHDGSVLKQASYLESEHDFSAIITPLFDLDSSKQRYRALKQTIGRSAEFEPRRRQDIDFVFLIARPSKARQLMPQLKFHRSGRLPVIATSHAYAGYENTQQDIDLEKLIITDMPWMFDSESLNDPAYIALKNNADANFNNVIRLMALGADAYRLIPELNGLSRSPELSFQGATGELNIEQNNVKRQALTATFKRGKVKLLTPKTDITD